MKKAISVLLVLAMLTMAGCGAKPEASQPENPQQPTEAVKEYQPLTAIQQPAPTDPVLEGTVEK